MYYTTIACSRGGSHSAASFSHILSLLSLSLSACTREIRNLISYALPDEPPPRGVLTLIYEQRALLPPQLVRGHQDLYTSRDPEKFSPRQFSLRAKIFPS